MDAGSSLNWLRTTDLAAARADDLLDAVEAICSALEIEIKEQVEAGLEDEAQAGEDMLDALSAIHATLNSGESADSLIQAFRENFWVDPNSAQPPEVVLEEELREIASGITRERWCTESYETLEQAINALLDGGDEDVFWDFLDGVEKNLERSAESYAQTDILAKEVTIESLVIHKLLCEGIHEWQAAIAVVREGDPDADPDWEAMLARAEAGNRLLITVQIYYGRLQRAVSFT